MLFVSTRMLSWSLDQTGRGWQLLLQVSFTMIMS